MICVQVLGNGTLQAVLPTPADLTTCALVVPSGSYVSASPFYMTREEGLKIGVAIALLWSVLGLVKIVSRRS